MKIKSPVTVTHILYLNNYLSIGKLNRRNKVPTQNMEQITDTSIFGIGNLVTDRLANNGHFLRIFSQKHICQGNKQWMLVGNQISMSDGTTNIAGHQTTNR